MDFITARWTIPHVAGPQSASVFFDLPVTGPVLLDLGVHCPTANYDPTKSGFRITDRGGRIVFPAAGVTDATVTFAGRGGFSAIMPIGSGYRFEHLDDELSGAPYTLRFEFFNEDAADIVVLVIAHIGQTLAPLGVEVRNFSDWVQSVRGVFVELLQKYFPGRD
jgi:hypothetical protein